MNASDEEQVRRDLFHDAVQQALEKQALEKHALEKQALEKQALEKQALEKQALEKQALEKQALEKQGRAAQRKIGRGSQPSCTEILTSSELRFLLKQDL
ncbi:MAG: hypothetical protein KUA37_14855 [Desulfomicrobium sp.]|nr:hypothetical protein [Pseudomonadota bacterium]MBU4571367.1 hypothetical protein [Pseudomonadota bacterium]MBU4595630.1 hypothetical protein [Pseudomonadota bacterium]MBV1713264.1 hypothetical protein [Desulfomicrobium sp.]MBV1747366.1 hypothetical protein [Desulfomicrobium sp.]